MPHHSRRRQALVGRMMSTSWFPGDKLDLGMHPLVRRFEHSKPQGNPPLLFPDTCRDMRQLTDHVFDEPERGANVADVHRAGEFYRRWLREADFHRGERASVVGP